MMSTSTKCLLPEELDMLISGHLPSRLRGNDKITFLMAYQIICKVLVLRQTTDFNLTEYEMVKQALILIDNDIVMPCSGYYSNFKKKVSSKKNQTSIGVCAPLYPQNLPESVVGIKSQEIGLTCEVFHKAVEGSLSHEEIDQVQKVDHVDNQLAYEIFEYAEKNLGRMTDCR